MHVLDQRIARNKRNPLTFLGGIALACFVFIVMGLAQLNVDFAPREPDEPISEFHLPPPPPPPVQEVPPKQTTVSINFNLPAVSGPADVPLGFLNVDFGLTPKELTNAQVNVDDTIEDFQTDGLEDLTVYDYKEVTEKPRENYRPPLQLDSRLIERTKEPFSFIIIVRITKNGKASDVHILDCPYPKAVPILKRWVMGMSFRAARKDGKPVDCLMRRRVTYRPSSGSPFSL
ncbi:MAG: hypothetical protein AAGB46_07695 [Verrucomicrobiota bacterium]